MKKLIKRISKNIKNMIFGKPTIQINIDIMEIENKYIMDISVIGLREDVLQKFSPAIQSEILEHLDAPEFLTANQVSVLSDQLQKSKDPQEQEKLMKKLNQFIRDSNIGTKMVDDFYEGLTRVQINDEEDVVISISSRPGNISKYISDKDIVNNVREMVSRMPV